MVTILIVEDEISINELVKMELRKSLRFIWHQRKKHYLDIPVIWFVSTLR
jgi:hypothetical protein